MEVGTGLAIFGVGLPAAVALLIPVMKLWPARKDECICPIREHEARMGEAELQVARLQENLANIKAALIRIENKLDMRNGAR